MSKVKAVKVVVKNALCVFNGTETGSSYKGGPIKYSLTLALVSDESKKSMNDAIIELTEGWPNYKIQHLIADKFKPLSEKSAQYVPAAIGSKVISAYNDKQPERTYTGGNESEPKIFGGDTVNAMLIIKHYKEKPGMVVGMKILAINLVKKGEFSMKDEFDANTDEEWHAVNGVDSDTYRNLTKKKKVAVAVAVAPVKKAIFEDVEEDTSTQPELLKEAIEISKDFIAVKDDPVNASEGKKTFWDSPTVEAKAVKKKAVRKKKVAVAKPVEKKPEKIQWI